MRSASVAFAAAVAGACLAVARPAVAVDPGAQECVAASEAAIQLRRELKLRGARAQLSICVSLSCPVEVREECARRIGEVNAAIPTMVFEVKTSSGNDVVDASVTIDGVVLTDRIDGTALRVDPGDHKFVFAAPGLVPLEKTFVAREGQKNRRETVVLLSSAPTSGPAPTAPQAGVQDEAGAGAATSWSAQKTFAIVVGGVGIVGVGVGSFFGLRASSKWSQAKSDCAGGCSNDAAAQGEKDDAHTAATLSTIAFGVGVSALLGATLLWFTAPTGSAPTSRTGVRVQPAVGAGSGSLILRGAF